jgi:hypothetical protein
MQWSRFGPGAARHEGDVKMIIGEFDEYFGTPSGSLPRFCRIGTNISVVCSLRVGEGGDCMRGLKKRDWLATGSLLRQWCVSKGWALVWAIGPGNPAPECTSGKKECPVFVRQSLYVVVLLTLGLNNLNTGQVTRAVCLLRICPRMSAS